MAISIGKCIILTFRRYTFKNIQVIMGTMKNCRSAVALCRVMTTEVVERCRRMLGMGATRQQVADVIGVDVKTIYKYLPASELSLCCVGAPDR
ncbi:TPA: hypothetical protein MIP48_28210 [Klebsiella pneumoniae]|nr:hypothetical protein [Klebsiella pneumoniae]